MAVDRALPDWELALMTARQIHIVGAGLSGLSAALQLALMGEKVTIHEAAPYAGGRCRSYYDRELGCRLDNGNHMILSGNLWVQEYLSLTHAMDTITSPPEPMFPFMDLHTGERWTLRFTKGRFPRWIFDPARRVAGTKPLDYLSGLKLLFAGSHDTIGSRFSTDSLLFRRFWQPMAVAALNTEPENASLRMLTALATQSFAAGGEACTPMVPKVGLSESFVTPCLETLRQNSADILFGRRLRALVAEGMRVKALDFGEEKTELSANDWVILAVPPWIAQELIPDLTVPNEFRSIINVHFKLEAPPNPAGFTGLIGGLAEWVFVKPGVVSVTISAADRYEETTQEAWAYYVWRDIAKLFDLDPGKVPSWRVVQEKRATFAATPLQNARRPHAYIDWDNLALAGDATQTSLPSCIEGAIRSGVKAAQVVMRWR